MGTIALCPSVPGRDDSRMSNARVLSLTDRPRFPAALRRVDFAGIALLVFLGIGATAGGLSLTIKPDGSIMQMPLRFLDGSPFADFFWPGLILLALFGVGSLATAALWAARVPAAPFLAFAIGCGQMIWIVVELAIIGELSFLHPTMFATGALIALCAFQSGQPVLRASRSPER